MEGFAPTGWRELTWPVAVHEAQEKLWRSRMFGPPSTDVVWCTTVPLPICLILLLKKVSYIRRLCGLDRSVPVFEVGEEPPRNGRVVSLDPRTVSLVSQKGPELIDFRGAVRLLGWHVDLLETSEKTHAT
jgi:hypothetical protein